MWQFLRNRTLTQWIIVSMVIGVLIGHYDPTLGQTLRPLSTAFLRAIGSIVAPILFGTLVMGIAGHGDDLKRVGRLALRSLIYFEIVTTVALFVGLAAVNLVKPGAGIVLDKAATTGQEMASHTATFAGFVEHVVPKSFVDAAANNEVLQIVFWSVLFAAALTQVKGKPKEAVLAVVEGFTETIFKLVGIIMKLAPIGVGAALAVTVGASGVGVLKNLALLVLTLYGALVVFLLVALLPVCLLFRVPIRRFIAAVKEPALIAFSTASSEAGLPLAMQNMEAFGVPRRIVAFVMPTGYSFNMDGTTLYLALASVFVAQAAGIPLTFWQQLVVVFTLMLTSKGVAGVPRASLVILSGTLATFGLPLEGVAVILGVDVFMDMARTSMNLVGNALATVVMARWEGEFQDAPAGA
jgi:proton glutamate symport protein